MNRPLDLGVTIEHVRVRCSTPADRRGSPPSIAGYLDGRTGAPLHDHRIVVLELRIDIEAQLAASRARSLGKAIAGDLADRLAAFQTRRQPSITHTPTIGGPIHIASLRVHLWGEPARHPTSHEICAALMAPLEERLRHG